jgi:hypothetical protein
VIRPASGLWLIAGQGFSSLGNIALTVLIARSSSATVLGEFALVLPLYFVVQRFTRAYLLIPRQVAVNSPKHEGGAAPYAAGVAIGAAAAMSAAMVGLFVSGGIGAWLWTFAAVVPGLILYDTVRNELLAWGRMRSVAILDLAWLVLQGVASAAVVSADPSPTWYLLAWGGATYVVVAGASFLRFGPSVAALHIGLGLAALRGAKARIGDATSDLFSSVLVIQAVPYLLAIAIGLESAAALRAGQTLFGPVNVVTLGLLPMLQIRAAENARNGRVVLRLVHHQTLILGSVATVYAALLLGIPDSIGRQLLGDTWRYAAVMFPGLAALSLARLPNLATVTALRSLERLRALSILRVCGAFLLLGGAMGGAALSLPAVSWGMALGAMLTSGVGYALLRRLSETPVRQAG